MEKTKESIRRIVKKRRIYDAIGLRNAVRKGSKHFRQYLEYELVRAGLDDASLLKLFDNDAFVQSLSQATMADVAAVAQELSFEGVENALDENVFDPMYEKELGGELDARMQERMSSMGLDFFGRETAIIKRRLKFPKLCFFAMAITTSAFTLTCFLKGQKSGVLLHSWMTYDLFRMSLNCYHKTYLLKGARAVTEKKGLGALLYDTLSSALTGSKSKTAAYLKDTSPDIILDGTYLSTIRYWWNSRNADPLKRD